MPQKITPAKRRRMLALHRGNVAGAEIMERFEIGDRRTLWRHLGLAEEEERQEEQDRRLLHEAMAQHVGEVWSLVGSWLKVLSRDEFGRARETLENCRELEDRTLFAAVKAHLPYGELWEDYEAWKELLGERQSMAVQLLVVAAREGERGMGLTVENGRHDGPRLTPSFANPILDRVSHRLNGRRHAPMTVSWRQVRRGSTSGLWAMCVDGQTVMVVEATLERGRCEQKYREVTEACAEVVRQLEELCDEVDCLADRLRRRLEVALTRQDHVLHRCELCPGGARTISGEADRRGSP